MGVATDPASSTTHDNYSLVLAQGAVAQAGDGASGRIDEGVAGGDQVQEFHRAVDVPHGRGDGARVLEVLAGLTTALDLGVIDVEAGVSSLSALRIGCRVTRTLLVPILLRGRSPLRQNQIMAKPIDPGRCGPCRDVVPVTGPRPRRSRCWRP